MARLTDAVFIAFPMDNTFSVVTNEKQGGPGQEDSILFILYWSQTVMIDVFFVF
jgi:hypothetical protein